MNKLRKTLPFVFAVLLVVLCYFGIELSHGLLPNYKNTLEKVEDSERISLLYFDNTASPELYPMNLYDSKNVKKAKTKYPYKYTNELVAGLMTSFCSDVYFPKDIDFDDYIEYLEYSQTDIYYIKDVRFTATNNRKYTLNVAFTKEDVLYFSCIPEYDEKLSSNKIEKVYESLETDLKMYKAPEYEYDQHERGNYYESFPIVEETYTAGYNNFVYFMGCFKKFDHYCKKLDMNLYSTTINEIISFSTSPSISYNEMMYLTFTDKNYQLVMIYDPNAMEFVGFSISERI